MATSLGQKTNLPSCLARRETRQIRSGHDWFVKKQTFRVVYVARQMAVICGQNGYFTCFSHETFVTAIGDIKLKFECRQQVKKEPFLENILSRTSLIILH